MHHLKTAYAHKMRHKCIKSTDTKGILHVGHGRVSGVQSDVTKWKGLNTRHLGDGAYLRAVFRFKRIFGGLL